jgi:hypothetical protein
MDYQQVKIITLYSVWRHVEPNITNSVEQALLEKLIVAQLVNKSRPFMGPKPEGS